jgi:flagellar motor switch/type III secretory pathway protein FliN
VKFRSDLRKDLLDMTDTIVEEIGGIQMKLDDLLRIEEDEVISQL